MQTLLPIIGAKVDVQFIIPYLSDSEKVKELCTIAVDIKKLPRDAFLVTRNKQGEPHHHVQFQMGVVFGVVLEFQLLWEGRVVGEIHADYLY